jgi:hypothetical protein
MACVSVCSHAHFSFFYSFCSRKSRQKEKYFLPAAKPNFARFRNCLGLTDPQRQHKPCLCDIDANPFLTEMPGFPLGELLGIPIWELYSWTKI